MKYPRLIVLFPSILVRADSAEHERRLRRSELHAMLWAAATGTVGACILAWWLA